MPKPAKLSKNMTYALQKTFSSQVGISYCTDRTLVARSGIIEGWMIKTGTSAALVTRDMLSPVKMVIVSDNNFFQRQQITAAGCEAIGRSMAEIVAWAWEQATEEYQDRANASADEQDYTRQRMTSLPVEVGAVVGWTHKGEAVTGEIKYIVDGAARVVVASDGAKWAVTLDEVERVIELPKIETPLPIVCAQCGTPVKQVRQQGTSSLVHVDYMDHAHDHAATLDVVTPEPGEPAEPKRRKPRKVTISKFREAREHDARLQADLSTGRADRKALPIVPPTKPEPKSLMALVNDAIAAALHSERVNTLGSSRFGGPEERAHARTAAREALEAVQQRVDDLERRAIPEQVDRAWDALADTLTQLAAEGQADSPHENDDRDAWRQRVLTRREARVKTWRTFADSTTGCNAPVMILVMAGGGLARAEADVENWKEHLK